jgi:hypothetical protein
MISGCPTVLGQRYNHARETVSGSPSQAFAVVYETDQEGDDPQLLRASPSDDKPVSRPGSVVVDMGMEISTGHSKRLRSGPDIAIMVS